MACVRAFKFFRGFRGGDSRAWLLTIVRHTYYTSLRDNRQHGDEVDFDEALHGIDEGDGQSSSYNLGNNPEAILASRDTGNAVNRALERLPKNFREIVVLKEIEDLSYKEIAEIAGIPVGTVMSRLARGRKLLIEYLKQYSAGESNGM
jgi:RNA polymerase sigma-70 factor (ECF subfamily)